MSVELYSKTENVKLSRSYREGGHKIFVHMPRVDEIDLTDHFFTTLELTREQAKTLAADLLDFANQLETVDYNA